MVSRKRGRAEMENGSPEPVSEEPTLLHRIRSMREFAAFMQYLFFFGKAVKIDDIEVEDFEQECLKPMHSERLSMMGLALLKQVSSHKGLTPDIFDEYTRRQYEAKAPQRNPFGVEEEPAKFADFDIFTKIKVLHQLSVWTMHNPNPIREKMAELDETQWRIEPIGWDAEDREYFVLDDDRLYCRTEPPLPPEPKPKARPKKTRNTRSNKRRRVSRKVVEDTPDEDEDITEINGTVDELKEPDPYGGWKWKLIAVTLDEYNEFIERHRRSKDPNEKALCQQLKDNVIPVLVAKAEEREREAARRAKELQNMEKLATAKRSSRLADKAERQKQLRELEEAERKHREELEMAHKEQAKQEKLEQDRQSRMITREQRIKEREVKRILYEEQLAHEKEQLAKMEEESKHEESDRHRMSQRNLKNGVKRRQKELESLQQSDDEWVFDCAVCGRYGQNYDDGTHSIACEKCGVWQHSACHGITQGQAEREDFHFLCRDCKEKIEHPIPPIKLKFGTSPKVKDKEHPSGKKRIEVHVSPKAPRPSQTNGSNVSVAGQAPNHPVSKGHSAPPLVYPGPPPVPPSTAAPRVFIPNGVTTGTQSGQPPAATTSMRSSIPGYAQGSFISSSTSVDVNTSAPGSSSRNWGNELSGNNFNQSGHLTNGSSHPQNAHGKAQAPNYQFPYSGSPPQLQHKTQYPAFLQQSPHSAVYPTDSPHKSIPASSPPITNGKRMGYSDIMNASPKMSFPPPVSPPHLGRPVSADKGSPSALPAGGRLSFSQSMAQNRSGLLPGSSPGYSPQKHSPPVPSSSSHSPRQSSPIHQQRPGSSHSLLSSFGPASQNPLLPPISLSPSQRPQILSPPIKNPNPARMPPVDSMNASVDSPVPLNVSTPRELHSAAEHPTASATAPERNAAIPSMLAQKLDISQSSTSQQA